MNATAIKAILAMFGIDSEQVQNSIIESAVALSTFNERLIKIERDTCEILALVKTAAELNGPILELLNRNRIQFHLEEIHHDRNDHNTHHNGNSDRNSHGGPG